MNHNLINNTVIVCRYNNYNFRLLKQNAKLNKYEGEEGFNTVCNTYNTLRQRINFSLRPSNYRMIDNGLVF